MDIKLGDKEFNLRKIESKIKSCVTQSENDNHTHIICLPELVTTGFALKNYKKLAEAIPEGRTTKHLQQWALEHSVYITTSYIEEERGQYFNSAVIVNPNGELIHKYRKIHLFPIKPMNESEYFSSGEIPKPTVIDIEGMIFGTLICFDVRYPEISRRLALDGVDCIIYLAEFPRPRDDVWLYLLKARAIENQIFVVGVNRVGGNEQIEYFGKSVFIDPLGNITKMGSSKEELLSHILDFNLISEARKFIPTLDLRQPNQY